LLKHYKTTLVQLYSLRDFLDSTKGGGGVGSRTWFERSQHDKQTTFLYIWNLLFIIIIFHESRVSLCMCLYRKIILLLLFIPSLFFWVWYHWLYIHPASSPRAPTPPLPSDDVFTHQLEHHPLETHCFHPYSTIELPRWR